MAVSQLEDGANACNRSNAGNSKEEAALGSKNHFNSDGSVTGASERVEDASRLAHGLDSLTGKPVLLEGVGQGQVVLDAVDEQNAL